ncbi:MAG: hypothetical protein IH596_09810, partial [Bacteroidales bacterium]|nr:hypothetical protein [Bacteroidales bacterium]
MKYWVFVFIPLFLCCTQPISARPTDNDSTEVTVKLQLKWKHQFQFAGYYAAIEQGYYRDEGFFSILVEETRSAPPEQIKFMADPSMLKASPG